MNATEERPVLINVREPPPTLSGLVPATRSPIIHEFPHTVNRFFTIGTPMKAMMNHESQQNWAELYAQHLEVWNERLSAALGAADFDSVAVFSGGEKTRFRDDQTYSFAVEPYFKAWLPLTRHPGSVLKLVPGEKPLLVILRDDGFWHEPAEEPTGFWVEHFDIREAVSFDAVLRELGTVDSSVAIIAEPTVNLLDSPSLNDETLLHHLDYFRAIKTTYEARCIERANQIAARGHIAAQRAFREGASEFHLHHVYCLATEQTDAELPYPNIVAINEHAAILHYQNLCREVPDRARSFLLDAGAQFNGYASDVTRTCTRDEPHFDSLIDSMEALQQTLCAEAVSGTDFIDLNERAHQLLATVMAEHGLLRCTDEEAYSKGLTRTFLPHGLGHLLGLQVHDIGGHLVNTEGEIRNPPVDHPMLRLTRILEPGFIVTIEPGIYFIPSLLDELGQSELGHSVDWDKLTELRRCGGIRVEDNLLISEYRSLNLSRPALISAGLS